MRHVTCDVRQPPGILPSLHEPVSFLACGANVLGETAAETTKCFPERTIYAIRALSGVILSRRVKIGSDEGAIAGWTKVWICPKPEDCSGPSDAGG